MTEHRPAVDIRWYTADDHAEWCRALDVGFLRLPSRENHEAVLEYRRRWVDPDRTMGAFDGPRCVATFNSQPQVLTVPGGATLVASGVTNVTVTATHRRRGLLSRMMARELDRCRERGEPLAILDAAEYGIYGRYGYGPATSMVNFEVDVHRAALGSYAPPANGRLDLVDPAEFGKHAPEVHERFRLARHGVIARKAIWWQLVTGELVHPLKQWKDAFHVLYRNDSGQVDGFLTYHVEDEWADHRPQGVLHVQDLIGATPEAEAELWRYAVSVDWVAKVVAENRPPDDILPLLLGDARSARRTAAGDFLWLRPLDVPRLLSERTYGVADTLVLEVHDHMGYAQGRFLLDGGPDGATCAATTREPDLVLEVGTLGNLYLGDESTVRLAAVGRIEASDREALSRADVMFRTGRRPWCPDSF